MPKKVWYKLDDGAVLGVGFSNWTERLDYDSATQAVSEFAGEFYGDILAMDPETRAATYLWVFDPDDGTVKRA